MKKRRTAAEILVMAVLTCCLAAVGVYAAAAGTADDPLVTMSYLNSTFMDEIMAKVEQLADNQSTGDSFAVVTVSKGQTVQLSLGAEAMLRVGTAKCVASGSPGLVDTTAGSTLGGGSALQTNHLYMATIDGRGIQAASETVKVLVRGGYTIK